MGPRVTRGLVLVLLLLVLIVSRSWPTTIAVSFVAYLIWG